MTPGQQYRWHNLADIVQQTEGLTLVTDGERRYGSILFKICQTVVRTGQRGWPRHTLPARRPGALKNKGNLAHRRGPERPKYEAPQPENPDKHAALPEYASH